jgi:hypothetical protein
LLVLASAPLAAQPFAIPSAARAGEDAQPAPEDSVAALKDHLADYDAAGGGDTIPIEKAVLGLGASKPEALVPFASHRRFGPLVITVCAEAGPGRLAADLVKAFDAHEIPARVESALGIAALQTDAARASLRALAAADAVKGEESSAARVRSALVRSGDTPSMDAVRGGLGSKDADQVAKALLTAGDARAAEFLADAAKLADDARKLATPIASSWPETKVTKSADGLSSTTETVPVSLTTVGAVALEAASRMGATTLPEWVAWWAWPEKGARFGQGADGVARLRAFAAADAKAAPSKMPRAFTAVRAVVNLVAQTSGEVAEFRFESATFGESWTVTGSVNGTKTAFAVDIWGKATKK